MDEEQLKAAEMLRAVESIRLLDERTKNWLRSNTSTNITPYEISQMSDKEILSLANIGAFGLKRLREFFAFYGIYPPCPHCGKK